MNWVGLQFEFASQLGDFCGKFKSRVIFIICLMKAALKYDSSEFQARVCFHRLSF